MARKAPTREQRRQEVTVDRTALENVLSAVDVMANPGNVTAWERDTGAPRGTLERAVRQLGEAVGLNLGDWS